MKRTLKKDEFAEQDLWAMLSYLFNMFTKSPLRKKTVGVTLGSRFFMMTSLAHFDFNFMYPFCSEDLIQIAVNPIRIVTSARSVLSQ